MADSVIVFLSGPDETTIVPVPRASTFDEFQQLIESKMGHKMRSTFELDGERVKLDSDDALKLFLALEMPRHKVLCTPLALDTRKIRQSSNPVFTGEPLRLTNTMSSDGSAVHDLGEDSAFDDDDDVEEVDPEDMASPTAPDYTQGFDADDVEGKITVYLDAPVTGHSDRILRVEPGIPFNEFESAVQRKLGHRMNFTFSRGDVQVSVDDDDSLRVFLLRPNADRRRLSCVPNGTITGIALDNIVYPTARPPVAHLVDIVEYQGHINANGEVTGAIVANATEPPLARSPSSRAAVRPDDRVYIGHTGAVHCCAFAPDGKKFVSASRDKTLRVWSLAGTSKLFESDSSRSGHVLSCAYSPSGDCIVSGNFDGTVSIWNSQTGKRLGRLKGHKSKVYCTAFNNNGAFVATASVDKTVRVWNVATRSQEAKLKGHNGMVFACAFSRTDGGQTIVSGSDDETLKIWDWRQLRPIRTLEGHLSAVWACNFSSDDRFIVSGAMDRQVLIWETSTGSVLKRFTGHAAPVHHVMFTRDDRYILSAGREGAVILWSFESGQPVHTLRAHDSAVFHFDYHGDSLLTCSHDATVKLHRLPLTIGNANSPASRPAAPV